MANGGASNHLCADNMQVPTGKGKFFTCNPKAYGRYVSVRIPGNGKYLTLCEVEVYSAYISSKRPTSIFFHCIFIDAM